ncbi:MAG: hypothetical protein M3P47_05815 [Pseudomonadota bacterium]|nr:hypothetical protein [Pseudomonadota bacterium]
MGAQFFSGSSFMHTYLLALLIATLCGGFAVVTVSDTAVTVAATTVKAGAAFVGYHFEYHLGRSHDSNQLDYFIGIFIFDLSKKVGYQRSESFTANGISLATDRWPACSQRGIGNAPSY